MSRQPMQTDVPKKAHTPTPKIKITSLYKRLSYMPSNTYSIINIILPEFGSKKILKINIMEIIKISIQEEFNLNLHNEQ